MPDLPANIAAQEVKPTERENELLPYLMVEEALRCAFLTAAMSIRLVSPAGVEKYEECLQREKSISLCHLTRVDRAARSKTFNAHALEQWLIGYETIVANVRNVRNRLAGVEREERENPTFFLGDEVVVMELKPPKKGVIVGQSKGLKDRPLYAIEVPEIPNETIFAYGRNLVRHVEGGVINGQATDSTAA
jgi:hypothetical protein